MADNDAGDAGAAAVPAHNFGACCNELKEAMSGEEFEPLITVAPDGVLYMSVGIVDFANEGASQREGAEEDGDEDDDDDEEGGPGMIDHPVFFCPFCGRKLQTREAVAAKAVEQEAGA